MSAVDSLRGPLSRKLMTWNGRTDDKSNSEPSVRGRGAPFDVLTVSGDGAATTNDDRRRSLADQRRQLS